MRTISRERLMQKLEKAYPEIWMRQSEEFDGIGGRIWTVSESCPTDKEGLPIFSNESKYTDFKEEFYTMGVRNHLRNFLERNGWYVEWYDSATLMIAPV